MKFWHDRAIEQFCQRSQYYYYDGFKQLFNGFFWTGEFAYPPENSEKAVILYKLHGSLGWKKHSNNDIERLSDESDPTYSQSMLIYPTLSPKEQEDEDPYRTIIYEFGQKLNECDICIIIGYSFRDVSINKFIMQLLKDNKKLIVVDKKAEHNIRNHFLKVITVEELSNGDRSILVDFDGKMIQIEIISNYIEPANMDEIVKKISLLL